MKVLKIFAFIGVLALGLSSCQKDEAFSIVGKWNMDKITSKTYVMGVIVDEETEVEIDAGWIQFNKDNTGVDNSGYKFSWTLNGDNLTINMEDADEDDLDVLRFVLTTKTSQRIVAEMTEDWGIAKFVMIMELSKL